MHVYYMCICVCVYIYIYIYIDKEPDRDPLTERSFGSQVALTSSALVSSAPELLRSSMPTWCQNGTEAMGALQR